MVVLPSPCAQEASVRRGEGQGHVVEDGCSAA